MGTKFVLILFLLALSMVAESANASWGFTKTCMSADDCLIGDDNEIENLMDSDINRRQLAGKRYISYKALKPNNVPCNRRGQSYYNCRKRSRANPYTRGCSVITHCKRFTS